MINVGMIGCGWIAEKAYLPIIMNMDDVNLSSVFDIDFQKAHEIQEKYGVPNIFDSIDLFLSQPLDGIIITAPNNTHTYYTNMALKAGKHVLCEKPVALSKSDIESTLAIAHTHNKIFLPAFVNRFRRDIVKFSEIVSLIGAVKEVEVSWLRKSGIPRPGTWITNKSSAGGGVLTDIGTHVIDIGLRFFSVKRIQSVKLEQGIAEKAAQKEAQWNKNNEIQKFDFDVETWAKGEVTFFDGSELKFNVDWSSDRDEDITMIKAAGVNGTVSIKTLFGFSNNFTRDNTEILYEETNGRRKKHIYPLINTFALDGFHDMFRYFIDLIKGQGATTLQPCDGVHVVDVIEHLYTSAQSDQVNL